MPTREISRDQTWMITPEGSRAKRQENPRHRTLERKNRVIRRFALGLLKRETSCRRGIETKRLKCAASDEYREKALFST